MRIRTLLGPPLAHEIVRDTATALVLSLNAVPAAARPEHDRAAETQTAVAEEQTTAEAEVFGAEGVHGVRVHR